MEFAQMSKEREHETTREDFKQLEKEYWNYVDNNVGPPIKV